MNNIILDAKQKFNKLLSKVPNTDNVLQYYDNMTYNIRFYMLSNSAQVILASLRENGQINNYIIPDDEKIIIAETGVSSKISIDSLVLKTIHANTCNTHSATTYSLEMTIKEINGCQLCNQIAAVSKLLGYEGYINQPYHIDIWFSGYDNRTHQPQKIIKEIGVLSYEVILGEVKSNIELSGTTYNFTCTCAGISSVSKDILAISDKGIFSSLNGLTLKDFKNQLVEILNKTYFEQNANHSQYYPNNKYLHIRLLDVEDKNIPQVWSDDYCSSTLANATLIKNVFSENNDNNEASVIKSNQESSLTTIFQEFCLNTVELKSYIVRPIYKVRQIKNDEGMELSEIYMDVLFSKSTYLENFNNRFLNIANKSSKDDIQQMLYSTAYSHLLNIISRGQLQKKYEWLFNGRDTSILTINTSVDKLWFANIPIWDIKENNQNTINIYNKYLQNDLLEKLLTMKFTDMSNNQILDEIKDAIHKTNNVINGVRNMSNDKRLYLEDIYHCMSTKMKKDLLNTRTIAEKAQSYSNAQPSSDTGANDSSITAKVGYNNLFSSNLVELQFEILGDPYWLELCSDNCLYNKNYNRIGNMQYFVFKMNTCADQKLDGTYDLENVVDFTNIYQIIESTSVFESGKFIQNIKAIISPEFLTLGRLEI